jgi:hypothetical protein
VLGNHYAPNKWSYFPTSDHHSPTGSLPWKSGVSLSSCGGRNTRTTTGSRVGKTLPPTREDKEDGSKRQQVQLRRLAKITCSFLRSV